MRAWCAGHKTSLAFALSLVALALLLGASQRGVDFAVLRVYAAIYFVTGLIWVVVQFHESHDETGRSAPMSWKFLIALLVVEAQLIAVFVRDHWSVGLVVSLSVVYVAAGGLINLLRGKVAGLDNRPIIIRLLPGIVVTVVAIALFAVAAAWLPAHRSSLALAGLAVALAIVLPVGLNLLAATMLRITPRLPMFIAGLAVVVATFIVFGLVAHSWKGALVVLAGAGLLMAALVSDTQLDVVLALVVIGVIGAVRPEQALAPPYQPSPNASTLVAFGDSYMSGEGAQSFFKGTDSGGGDQCRRAPTAWAALAVSPQHAAATGAEGLAFLACSGAITTNVEPDGVPQPGETLTQVPAYQALQATPGIGPFTPKLAVVSLGGNDAGFATIGEMCIAPGDCSDELTKFEGNLPTVGNDLYQAYTSIRAALGPNVPVVAIPYPSPIDRTAKSCGELALAPRERASIGDFLTDLDDEVHQAANRAHFYYLDSMVDALAGHQLCDRHAGINFVRLYSLSGAAGERFNPKNWLHDSLHPNPYGHRLMLAAFTNWLARHPGLVGDAPATPVTMPVLPSPVCAISACKSDADKFALQQLVDRVGPYGGFPLALILGFALLWAACFGSARERFGPVAGARTAAEPQA